MILLPQDYWEIKSTVLKGRGIYAKKDIDPGTVIGDYIGKVIRTAEEDTSERNGLYLMYYHDYASIYPEDVTAPGVHLINHSCVPNSWMYTYHGHTLFFTLRHIFAGEEITASYLLSPDDHCTPCLHECKCGHKLCVKTMHQTQKQFDAWDSFHAAQTKKTKRAKVQYGKTLQQLPSYPDNIPDNELYSLIGNTTIKSVINEEPTLPSIKELRNKIRVSGKTLLFPKLSIRVLGVRNGTIILEAC